MFFVLCEITSNATPFLPHFYWCLRKNYVCASEKKKNAPWIGNFSALKNTIKAHYLKLKRRFLMLLCYYYCCWFTFSLFRLHCRHILLWLAFFAGVSFWEKNPVGRFFLCYSIASFVFALVTFFSRTTTNNVIQKKRKSKTKTMSLVPTRCLLSVLKSKQITGITC